MHDSDYFDNKCREIFCKDLYIYNLVTLEAWLKWFIVRSKQRPLDILL